MAGSPPQITPRSHPIPRVGIEPGPVLIRERQDLGLMGMGQNNKIKPFPDFPPGEVDEDRAEMIFIGEIMVLAA